MIPARRNAKVARTDLQTLLGRVARRIALPAARVVAVAIARLRLIFDLWFLIFDLIPVRRS